MDAPEKIPALVLAAGLSTRMDAFKPLLSLAGKPLVQHVLDALLSSQCLHPIIVVTGHRRAELEAALPAAIHTAFNPDFSSGEMLSSVKSGLQKLAQLSPSPPPGFLLAFADQPAVLSATIRLLVNRFLESRAAVVQPLHAGRKGHPLILSAALLQQIHALPISDTLRTLTHRHAADFLPVPVADPAVLEDLDTPEDFVRAAARLRLPPAANPEGH